MIIRRDMKHAKRARAALRSIPAKELVGMCEKAADIFVNDELPMGDDLQGPEHYVRCQSATTGLPEPGPRLQDVLDTSVPFTVTVHEGFDYWLAADTEVTPDVAASLEEANSTVIPTVTSVR